MGQPIVVRPAAGRQLAGRPQQLCGINKRQLLLQLLLLLLGARSATGYILPQTAVAIAVLLASAAAECSNLCDFPGKPEPTVQLLFRQDSPGRLLLRLLLLLLNSAFAAVMIAVAAAAAASCSTKALKRC